MIVDVLRGSRNAQILDKKYENLSTYGLVKNISWADLHNYCVQLINQGVLEIWFHEKHRLVLTPLANKILFKGKKISLIKPSQQEKTISNEMEDFEGFYERGILFEKLRFLRMEIAREKKVPPFVIFPDTSLEDMEKKLPTTLDEFSTVFGVGKKKLDQYGVDFTTIIQRHLDEKSQSGSTNSNSENILTGDPKSLIYKLKRINLSFLNREIIPEEKRVNLETLHRIAALNPDATNEVENILTADEFEVFGIHFQKCIKKHFDDLESTEKTHIRSYNLFNHGFSVEEIAEKRGLNVDTIYGHFVKANQDGLEFDFSPFISAKEIEAVEKASKTIENMEGIKTYFDHFNGELPYWKIRMGLHLNNIPVPFRKREKQI